jgi:hypothetical protein
VGGRCKWLGSSAVCTRLGDGFDCRRRLMRVWRNIPSINKTRRSTCSLSVYGHYHGWHWHSLLLQHRSILSLSESFDAPGSSKVQSTAHLPRLVLCIHQAGKGRVTARSMRSSVSGPVVGLVVESPPVCWSILATQSTERTWPATEPPFPLLPGTYPSP